MFVLWRGSRETEAGSRGVQVALVCRAEVEGSGEKLQKIGKC